MEVTLRVQSVRLADDSLRNVVVLRVERDEPDVWRFNIALDDEFRMARGAGCIGGVNDPSCPMMHVEWRLDGHAMEGLGVLRDVLADGVFEPWSRNPENPSIGRRIEVPLDVARAEGLTTIKLANTPGYLESQDLHGTYVYDVSSDLPLLADVAPGSKWAHRWTRTSLETGEPFPDVVLPSVPTLPLRPEGLQMFNGENQDAFSVGFSPKQALDHLRNASLDAKGDLDGGGCVVKYVSEAPVPSGTGQRTTRIELSVKAAEGPVAKYEFRAYEALAGLPPVFGDVTSLGMDDNVPLESTCEQVLRSPAAVSSATFLQRARDLGLTSGGEFFFQWHATDRTGQKPLVPGVGHFLLAFYPEGWNATTSGTFIPYRAVMDADTGWWESMTMKASDFPSLDGHQAAAELTTVMGS